MRWHSESWQAMAAREREWHRWFAWYPVRVDEQRVWLEAVERRRVPVYEGWDTHYRLIEEPPTMPRKDMA